jgi:hypothetical protein
MTISFVRLSLTFFVTAEESTEEKRSLDYKGPDKYLIDFCH